MNNHHHHQQQQQFQQNMEMGSGLTRYQSAPSRYFSSLLNSTSNSSDATGLIGTDDFEQLFNPPASTTDTPKIFSRVMNTVDTVQENCASNINLKAQVNSQFLQPRKSEPELHQPHQQLQRQQSNDYSSVPHIMYHSHNSEVTNSSIPSSYTRLMGSINSNPAAAPAKMEGGGSCGRSNLIRHSSSPAGLFKNTNIKNEIAAMGNFGAGNSANAEAASFSTANRFKSQMDFSSRQTSTSGMMATISEIGSKGTGENNPGDELLDENGGKDSNCIPDYPINSWDDSVILSDNFLKELTENDQGNEGGNRPTTLLSHHLSLPKSSAELFAMEQLLQDTVPCKIRAKRGFATHPRSIAERVRRTKISQRMRKLQELVPNMEKQTNTADMLDLAVDYIKDLQRQVKDQVLLGMQQKLDNLCEQVCYFKDQPEIVTASDVSITRRMDCGFKLNQHPNVHSHDSFVKASTKGLNGDDVFKYKMPLLSEAEPEERRMSDLSDWSPSVTSSVDLQLDTLAYEHDINSLRKECEEKDAIIKELSTLLHSAEAFGSKRTAELEDMICRKNMIINKLRKDILILEQKVVSLTRLRRPSFSAPSPIAMPLPVMADNVLYDMDSTTGPSSSDSDSSSPKNQNQAPAFKRNEISVQTTEKASSEELKNYQFKLSTHIGQQHQKLQTTSPLKEKSLNQTNSLPVLKLKHKTSANAEKGRRRPPTKHEEVAAAQKRLV